MTSTEENRRSRCCPDIVINQDSAINAREVIDLAYQSRCTDCKANIEAEKEVRIQFIKDFRENCTTTIKRWRYIWITNL